MRTNYRYILLVLSILTISCVEENLEPLKPAQNGDIIAFGARAGFENGNPDTKTIYSGEHYQVIIGNKTTVFERIDWVDNVDKVQIYCKEAANGPIAHYTINDASTPDDDDEETKDQVDEAYLMPSKESSLQWNGDGNHTFYALYPSSELFTEDATLAQGVEIKEASVSGTVPRYQYPTMTSSTTDGITHYIANPDMRYAYMVAKEVANRTTGVVSLNFVPVVTCVQLELTLPNNIAGIESIDIAEVRLQGEGIAGEFNVDLSDNGWKDNATYPSYSRVGEGSNTIQITTRINDQPITIMAGGSLTLTAFMRPGANIENLKVYISPEGSKEVGITLQGVTIKDNCKNNISNLILPKNITYQDSDWLNSIPENTEMKALSLPGTGGSFTYDATNANYKQQQLTFDEQWAAGIRAFEVSSDRPNQTNRSLGRQYVTCNKENITNWSIIKVFNTIIDKVTTTGETAVIILTYQPESNTPARNATEYAKSLSALLIGSDGEYSLTAERQNKIIAYTPGLTYGQAKGRIIVLCRINQRGEDDGGSFEAASEQLTGTNVTLINGCGTAKDRWGARGYKVDYKERYWEREWSNGFFGLGAGWEDKTYGEYGPDLKSDFALDLSNTIHEVTETITNESQSGFDKEGGYVEYYMNSTTTPIFTSYSENSVLSYKKGEFTVYRPRKNKAEDLNFGFATNVIDNNNKTICWYQEWARVIPENIHVQGRWTDPSNGINSGNYNISWFESYTEKLSNATTTFELAINGTYPNYVYVNSLCGYLGTSSTNTTSYGYSLVPSIDNIWGGAGGDISGLATRINKDFCQYVLNSGMKSKSGPTGIILMDFVNNVRDTNNEYDGSYLLPGAIISNNFKY